jgi:hypothetical protein
MSKKLFESMDEVSRRFYSRVFNTATLNAYAVQRGYFDTLLCATEDPRVAVRWAEALPGIIQRIQDDNANKDPDGSA